MDDETGNEEEEFFIDTEEEKSAEGNEAVCDQTERPDRRYVTDYKNQGYYSLSKKIREWLICMSVITST